MEFSITFGTVKSGWSIVYIEGSQVLISQKQKYCISFSEDPDGIPHHAEFNLGLQCLPKH